jgi:hypothetical protein
MVRAVTRADCKSFISPFADCAVKPIAHDDRSAEVPMSSQTTPTAATICRRERCSAGPPPAADH